MFYRTKWPARMVICQRFDQITPPMLLAMAFVREDMDDMDLVLDKHFRHAQGGKG